MTFGRRIYTPPPAAPLRPLERAPNYASAAGMSTPVPKEPRLENPHLLLMARNVRRPCLLAVPGVCMASGPEFPMWCCACHGNSSIYGKGGHIKAHDFYTVWGCYACHYWLDQSHKPSAWDRQEAFERAHIKQIIEWANIYSSTVSIADRVATSWALARLVERGYKLDHLFQPTDIDHGKK